MKETSPLSLQLLEQYIALSVVFYTYSYFQVNRDESWQGEFTFQLEETRYTLSAIYRDGIVGETSFTFQ